MWKFLRKPLFGSIWEQTFDRNLLTVFGVYETIGFGYHPLIKRDHIIYPCVVKASASSSVDDMIVVNGTHMSEEAISARILQSLSQKAVYHHTSSNVSSNVSSNGVAVYRNIQTVPTSHRSSQPAVHVHIIHFFFSNDIFTIYR